MPFSEERKSEFIEHLQNSGDYLTTIRLVHYNLLALQATQWTDAELARLFAIAQSNEEVGDCIGYLNCDNDTARFYESLLEQYADHVTTDENALEIKEMLTLLDGTQVREFLQEQRLDNNNVQHNGGWRQRSEGLYHANSVTTSLSFLKAGFLFPRSEGDADNTLLQTPQASDDLDQDFGIYEDIFFDNMDLAACFNGSVYGPIMFVFDDSILMNQKVRVTKTNPCGRGTGGWNQRSYEERFFISVQAMRDEAANEPYGFLSNGGHHVTLYHKKRLPLRNGLRKILIERNVNDEQMAQRVKRIIENLLQNHQINHVEVIIRDSFDESIRGRYATDYDVLWEIPAEFEDGNAVAGNEPAVAQGTYSTYGVVD